MRAVVADGEQDVPVVEVVLLEAERERLDAFVVLLPGELLPDAVAFPAERDVVRVVLGVVDQHLRERAVGDDWHLLVVGRGEDVLDSESGVGLHGGGGGVEVVGRHG